MNTNVIVKIAHDNGTANIKVWAQSIEAAIEAVCSNEKAPKRAVISAKVAPLTIYDIKRAVEEKSSFFFSRQSMKFFGQKMADFSVRRHGVDKFYICAKWGKGIAGKTERIFNPFTGELERVN
jgi:hypothetical protein